MAESQKTAAPVKSKVKNSLLDIDIDKDFLGSWKSMSMGDDGMDFDFGPTTEGKKKAFKFDKMDMDFSLDADFGKSSFKMDMAALDISSPTKKSGKANERSKEASSGGENQGKRESFQFSFDFDEFAELKFESKKTKIDEKSNKSKDKEVSVNASGSGGSGDFLTKDVGASEDDDLSIKIPASRGVTFSDVDTHMDNIKDPDPRNEDDHLKSAIDESYLLKPENAKEQDIQRPISPEKIISFSVQEPIQESHSSEKRSSPEPHAQEVKQNLHGHSLADNVSTESIFSDLQEESSRTVVRMVSPSTEDGQNGIVRPVAELVPTRSLSADMNVQSQKSDMCEARDDNVVIGHIGGDDDTSKADSHLENSVTPGIENLAHGETIEKRNADLIPKLHRDSLDSGTTTDEMVSEKERGNIPIRSKYFNRQNGSESELQQASVSSTKLISVGNKRLSTLTNNPSLEKREFGSRSVESGSKFTGISRSLPKVLSRDILVQTENTETGHAKGLENTRECLNADNIKLRNEPMVTAVKHDIDPKEKPVSKGNHQNIENNSALRSDVLPSSSTEQSNKNLPRNTLNPGLQVTSMTSTRNMMKIVVEKSRISPTKAEMKTSEVSTLRVSRATEPKLKTLNSVLPKGLTSMKSKEQGPEFQGNLLFRRNPSVDTKKQTPSTPSLKRKTLEESAETPRSTPSKRISASPSYNIRSPREIVVDKQVCNDANMGNKKSPRLDVSQTEMDISSDIENDGNFEKAEACSKELEDICNMLKKKHEEAKDILVRAIVNNNNLLMLNHPIYQEKIRMVQKFSSLLINK